MPWLRFAAPIALMAALCAFGFLPAQTPAFGQAAKSKAGVPLPPPPATAAEPKETPAAATEHAYYTVCMNLIQREWEVNHTARVLELLEDTKNSRFRGFEWGYWSRMCRREVKLLNHPAFAIAISPDGSRIALGDENSSVTLCDAATGKEIWTGKEKPVSGRGGWMRTLAFTPDGKHLLSCDSESTTVVWDAKTGEALQTLFGSYSGTRAAFSSDGKRMLISYRGSWGAIRDLATGKDLLTNPAKQYDQLYSVALSPNGKRFAHSNDDKKAHISDAETGKELCATSAHALPIDGMTFSPDGSKLVTASRDHTAKVWDVETGRELHTLSGHTGEVWIACFSPDGRYIATGSDDGTARIWDTETGKELQIIRGHTSSVGALAFHPNGRQLVTGAGDGTTKLWNLETGDPALSPQKPALSWPKAGSDAVQHVMTGMGAGMRTFSPDGNYVARAWKNGAEVWNIPQGKRLYSLSANEGEYLALAFSPDSALLATSTADGGVKVREAASGKEMQSLKGHTGAVSSLTFLYSSQLVATASVDGTAKIWNVKTGQERLTLKGHTAGLTSIRFFPEGSHIVTESADKTMRVWESTTGRQVGMMLAGLAGWITLSLDGSRAVSYYPYNMRLWNLKTGQEIRTLPINSGYSRGIAFSPDLKRVFTGTSGQELSGVNYSAFHIWDADTGRDLLTLPRSTRNVSAAHFSPDGKQIHVTYWDGYTDTLRSEPL